MTMLMARTRHDALAHARYEYRTLAQRAYEAAPGPERDYVAMSAIAWDRRLNELEPSPTPLSDDEARVIDHLTVTVSDPMLSLAAIMEWVDAFPTAISELFSDSGVVVHGDFDTDEWIELPFGQLDPNAEPRHEAEAANKQPALARAA